MNVVARVRAQIRELVAEAINQARFAGEVTLSRDVSPDEISVERPKDRAHGDWATNAALVLSREARTAPRMLAEAAARHLNLSGTLVERAEVAGPGFINFFLRDEWLIETLRAILAAGPDYGKSRAGEGRRVLVEFVSANPTGPLNVVNARHAAVGDVLSNILMWAGYRVDREFYVNDAGNQVRMLGAAMDVRIRQLLGEDARLPEGAYAGEYLIDVAREFLREHGTAGRPAGPPPWEPAAPANEANSSAPTTKDGERDGAGPASWRTDPEYEAWLSRLARFAVEKFVERQREVLRRYRVEYDRWYFESEIRAAGGPEQVVRRLSDAGHTYRDGGALWLASTRFGDDKDRVLVKADGEYTYVVPDIAYHVNKLERGYDLLIDLLGRDHYGYHVRLKAALSALGFDPQALEVLYLHMVHLVRGGEEVRMSKRRGEIVDMAEFLDEVSVDAARYFFVMRSIDSEMEFDLDLANLKTSDNPVYYVQYAHARLCSLFRQAQESGLDAAGGTLSEAPLERLASEPERDLLRKLAEFPDEVELAALRREPHRMTRYAHEVASAFHVFYTRCRVLGEEAGLTAARLALCAATRQVLANVLGILGIDAPEQM
ncbi:MAG: arginine--tRNA ligase [Firmicutes bacterium]|nr:arginine--tRNA ligase [Bacillota bacterium]